MARLPFHCNDIVICEGLEALRLEQEIPDHFSDDVVAEAVASAAAGPQIPPGSAGTTVVDRTNLEMVTIDPPSSMDLDQAVHIAPTGSGWRVHYAISDVAAWVAPGGPIDLESQERGFTMYSPDGRSPLHPQAISEGAASLLPGVDRQSLLWTIDLDDEGRLIEANLERSLVRSRAKLSYRDAAALIDNSESAMLADLKTVGLLREALEIERGAVSLRLASQEVVATPTGFTLEYDESLPIEGWNAQISLLTGIAAAKIMVEGRVGLLRTLPRPDERTIRELRRTAKALGIDWPKSRAYADVVRGLDPNDPVQAAMIAQSARGLRGAGYEAFNGTLPEHTEHSAISADYAHVTAPLRRLGDRYGNECVLAVLAGQEPPEWVLERLPELPRLLGRARNREGSLDRAVFDLVEAALLIDRVGQSFDGLVTAVDESKDRVRVQLVDPAVVAYADGNAALGQQVSVRLDSASVSKRLVKFSLA
ncbi:MAG: exoribonuclease R [Verrucomicrobiales bacterium]|jgi:exoribonuclease R